MEERWVGIDSPGHEPGTDQNRNRPQTVQPKVRGLFYLPQKSKPPVPNRNMNRPGIGEKVKKNWITKIWITLCRLPGHLDLSILHAYLPQIEASPRPPGPQPLSPTSPPRIFFQTTRPHPPNPRSNMWWHPTAPSLSNCWNELGLLPLTIMGYAIQLQP